MYSLFLDPHPGNILLLEDGRLGLIDYGQVKRIPPESRVLYARMLKALAKDDEAELIRLVEQGGYKTKYSRTDIAIRLMKFWHDTNSKAVTDGMNPQLFIDWCEAQDPVISVPSDFIMPGRVSVLLRGIGNAFGIDLQMAKLWLPIAEEVIQQSEADEEPLSFNPSTLQRKHSEIAHKRRDFR